MTFALNIAQRAQEDLQELKHSAHAKKQFVAVTKALQFLSNNPRHPSLRTHKFTSLHGPQGEEVFEAYAEQNTPAAYRIFFFYGPRQKEITIFAITPHP